MYLIPIFIQDLLCSAVFVPQIIGVLAVAPTTENVSVKHWEAEVMAFPAVDVTPFSIFPTLTVLVDGPDKTNVRKSKRN